MKHIIVGTAGHVDHGKTALVKAITGVDTDTLEEEKKRGITINNGYTYFKLDDENTIAIIDVPGHEKFIKNMVSGVSSVDIVMLIIAADEGIMPQTREHMDILRLLDIKKGIVVLTKSDLVDSEWLDFMKEEVREFISDSFMKNAPIIGVSSKTGDGISNLCDEIKNQINDVSEKDKGEIFRLPIDRVFKVNGFGTVVTGSILSGSVNIGDELEISDEIGKAKVRGIQVHGEDRDKAFAGERCAINIVLDNKLEVKRGMFVYEVDKQENSYMIDARINLLNIDGLELVNRQRVRVYHYAKEVMARVVLLDKEVLKSGESGFIQLRLEEEISSKPQDKIVIRTYSPMNTIAGATILDSKAIKAKRFKEEYIKSLEMKESGDISVKVENILLEKSNEFILLNEVASILNISIDEVYENIEKLLNDKKIIKLEDNLYVHNRFILELENRVNKVFKEFYNINPLKVAMNKDALKGKVIEKKIKVALFDKILENLLLRDVIKQSGVNISLKGYEISLTKEQKKIKDDIIKKYNEFKFSAPRFEDIIATEKNKKDYKLVLNLLIEEGSLIYLEDNLFINNENYNKVKADVISFINENGKIILADLKEMTGTSRRYLVAIFEKLDREKVTKREEDYRILV